MDPRNTNHRPVKTVNTAFSILEFLKDEEGATLSELDQAFDLAKSTIHRHLGTLVQREYAVREGLTYHPSLRFLDYGEYTKKRKVGFTMAAEKVEELAEETEERAQFIVEEHGRAVYIHRAIGRHAVETDPGVGKRVPLHATAAGKAILAQVPEEKADEIIEWRGLPSITENTITDEEQLRAELEEIREQGYSVNTHENMEGLRALGVPVRGEDNDVIGALSVSGPAHRFKGEWFSEELPDLLRGMANEIELNVTYG